MDIVERAKNILLTPAAEWPVIAGETTSVEAIYRGYVVYLAAIPPVAAFVGLSLLGPFAPFGTLAWAAATYVLALFVVYVIAIIINALAPSFGGTPNFLAAFKLAAYSMTAAWVAGIFSLVPIIGILGFLLSLYSIYLFYVGVPVLMRSPPERSLIYTVAVVVCGAVVRFVASWILLRLFLSR